MYWRNCALLWLYTPFLIIKQFTLCIKVVMPFLMKQFTLFFNSLAVVQWVIKAPALHSIKLRFILRLSRGRPCPAPYFAVWFGNPGFESECTSSFQAHVINRSTWRDNARYFGSSYPAFLFRKSSVRLVCSDSDLNEVTMPKVVGLKFTDTCTIVHNV